MVQKSRKRPLTYRGRDYWAVLGDSTHIGWNVCDTLSEGKHKIICNVLCCRPSSPRCFCSCGCAAAVIVFLLKSHDSFSMFPSQERVRVTSSFLVCFFGGVGNSLFLILLVIRDRDFEVVVVGGQISQELMLIGTNRSSYKVYSNN